VYSHGRRDGEVNSTAIAEALFFGLPIVSHISEVNNGHVECIGHAGRVVDDVHEYAMEMERLMNDNLYYDCRSENAKRRFNEKYELSGQISNIVRIYRDVARETRLDRLKRKIKYFKPGRINIRHIIRSLIYVRNLKTE